MVSRTRLNFGGNGDGKNDGERFTYWEFENSLNLLVILNFDYHLLKVEGY